MEKEEILIPGWCFIPNTDTDIDPQPYRFKGRILTDSVQISTLIPLSRFTRHQLLRPGICESL